MNIVYIVQFCTVRREQFEYKLEEIIIFYIVSYTIYSRSLHGWKIVQLSVVIYYVN
jgi:hypothetical protein